MNVIEIHSRRVVIKPLIPACLFSILIFAYFHKAHPKPQEYKVFEVAIVDQTISKAAMNALLDFNPRTDYYPVYDLKNALVRGHDFCCGSQPDFADPRELLVYFWSELSPQKRKEILIRLGYPGNATIKQLLYGPQPQSALWYRWLHGQVTQPLP